MTIKELADLTGKDRKTILLKIKELLPDLEIAERTKINLNDEQAHIILNAFPEPPRYLQKTAQKITRVLHLTQRHDVKYDLSAAALEKLSKIMTDDELKAYIHHVLDLDTQITASQGPKQIEKPKEDEEKQNDR